MVTANIVNQSTTFEFDAQRTFDYARPPPRTESRGDRLARWTRQAVDALRRILRVSEAGSPSVATAGLRRVGRAVALSQRWRVIARPP